MKIIWAGVGKGKKAHAFDEPGVFWAYCGIAGDKRKAPKEKCKACLRELKKGGINEEP